ncbi:MAG: mevalonate kinase [Patescibacteria group bacterium]
MIKVSAPGKLMLLGDHAVVYGYPCIVTAVDKRLYVEAEIIDGESDDIITPQVKECRFVLESISCFKNKYGIRSAVRVKTNGDFSHQVGLGSSSAVTVATFKALSLLYDISITTKELFDMSYQVTLRIQGLGSGFDIAAATYGKTIYYVTAGKIIDPLHIAKLPLVVGYSGVKADTPFYVRKVEEDFRTKGEEMKNIFCSIQKLVEDARHALIAQKFDELGIYMDKNHELLKRLGVSTVKLDDMVSAARDAGAWGAKLSGAGGGDCMIALVDENRRTHVERAIEKAGGEIIRVQVNTEGMIIER